MVLENRDPLNPQKYKRRNSSETSKNVSRLEGQWPRQLGLFHFSRRGGDTLSEIRRRVMNQLIKKKERKKMHRYRRPLSLRVAELPSSGREGRCRRAFISARAKPFAPAQRGLIINVEWRRARNLKTFLQGVLSAGSLCDRRCNTRKYTYNFSH